MKLLLDLQGAQSDSRLRGIGRQTRSLAKAIIRHGGHDVSIVLGGLLRDNFEPLRAEFAGLLPANRILTFQAAGPVAEKDLENDWRMQTAELEREAFIARHHPDIVHVGSVFEGFLDDTVCSIGRLVSPHATAATLHDLIPLLNPAKYLENPRYRRHYLRRAQSFKRADLLLAVSGSARQEAMDFLHIEGSKIAVIRGGVDERFKRLAMSPEQDTILRLRFRIGRDFVLYVGAVDPRKNIDILIHAFAMLPSDCRAAHCLVVAGPLQPEERGRVRGVGARHGLGPDELVFCGHVSDDDLVALYTSCALFVFPSRHEGFGLPVLEAMACGAPVLAADRTSLPEIVGRPDLLFDPDKPDDLCAKMHAILTDDGRRASLQEWGTERAAEYTWDDCARRAVDAFAALHERRSPPAGKPSFARRPKLAFVSPLPGDRTGIADYAAELLPELAIYYDVECIIQDTVVTDPWITANIPLRDIGWFERNAATYDRIVYSIGNSHYHAHMFDLLQCFPGIVLLHDFFLSNLLEWMSNTDRFPEDTLVRELYLTHGTTGLLLYRNEGTRKAVERFACNGQVFRQATGVIVHSKYSASQAERLFGPSVLEGVEVVPHVRAGLSQGGRAAARSRLGFAPDEFVVCVFGLVTAQKRGRVVLDAWTLSALGQRSSAALVYVGGVSEDDPSQDLLRVIGLRREASRVSVTGHVSQEKYRDYLASADLAVQLRKESRGETSGAILDCFAVGLPVIINAHGPAAELPPETVCMLPDEFSVDLLVREMERFDADREAGAALGQRGRHYVLERHHPARVGADFRNAVETLTRRGVQAQQQVLVSAVANQHTIVAPDEGELARLAECISHNSAKPGLRQIMCDVTVLAEQDAKTGIQRVVRSVLKTLMEAPPAGFRIEAVRIERDRIRYARGFTEKAFGIPAAVLPDSEVDYGSGDIYLGIDWVPDRLPNVVPWLHDFRASGGRVIIAIYDLLPLLKPQFFPDFMSGVTQRWFEAALAVSDQLVCISRTVADDVERFAIALGEGRHRDLAIDFFHMGSNLAASQPSRGLPSSAKLILAAMERRRSFVMVGTVEPRKGHGQVVPAFDALWRENADVGLVIVGKRGWMVEEIARSIEQNAEFGKRLFWLQDVSDEMLDRLYSGAAGLIAASAGEGFGLPLIEAALHGVALIARDTPVFREVAGRHAFYFDGEEPADLTRAIHAWLRLERAGQAPGSAGMPHQSWRAATAELLHVMFSGDPYKRVTFDPSP